MIDFILVTPAKNGIVNLSLGLVPMSQKIERTFVCGTELNLTYGIANNTLMERFQYSSMHTFIDA